MAGWSDIQRLTKALPGCVRSALQNNPDGCVDLYFAPAAPEGKESNWIPTVDRGRFEVLMRFYGPEKTLFDKTWRLEDIEKSDGEGGR